MGLEIFKGHGLAISLFQAIAMFLPVLIRYHFCIGVDGLAELRRDFCRVNGYNVQMASRNADMVPHLYRAN